MICGLLPVATFGPVATAAGLCQLDDDGAQRKIRITREDAEGRATWLPVFAQRPPATAIAAMAPIVAQAFSAIVRANPTGAAASTAASILAIGGRLTPIAPPQPIRDDVACRRARLAMSTWLARLTGAPINTIANSDGAARKSSGAGMRPAVSAHSAARRRLVLAIFRYTTAAIGATGRRAIHAVGRPTIRLRLRIVIVRPLTTASLAAALIALEPGFAVATLLALSGDNNRVPNAQPIGVMRPDDIARRALVHRVHAANSEAVQGRGLVNILGDDGDIIGRRIIKRRGITRRVNLGKHVIFISRPSIRGVIAPKDADPILERDPLLKGARCGEDIDARPGSLHEGHGQRLHGLRRGLSGARVIALLGIHKNDGRAVFCAIILQDIRPRQVVGVGDDALMNIGRRHVTERIGRGHVSAGVCIVSIARGWRVATPRDAKHQ
ncbi:hypothetical protein DN745_02535 [Bradymonas sediminis]|uniref:Uncharacterized protein n=1 Tax=Bradymonas sediminis TaxID=1548548 RepID=A0A2Z4FHP3_9DELT|nr:hypothetical protein DN745_02535 [Bradymonas sediminis]